NVIQRLDHK
ncbi:hypothetical protein CISIN_1g0365441mg, partial [Citrus sinensis]